MLMKLKKSRIFWTIFCFLSSEYQPPFGSVGHSVQSGRITGADAVAYLNHTHKVE